MPPGRELVAILGGDVLRRHASCLALDAFHHEPGVNRRAAPLVDEHMRALLGEEHPARFRLGAQRGLVRHRRGRKKERRLVPEQLGHPPLKLVDGRILEVLLVADLGGRHRSEHFGGRLRHRVRAEVDHRPGRYRNPVDLTLLDSTLAALGEPAYRAQQVWEWTARGAAGYDAMTNLPRALREELEATVPFSTLTVETQRESRDGTVKTLFRTADGHPVEAVLMRYRDRRRTLCLSSQSGCPLTCTFCATGQMAFGRNLTASEILDQALHFRRIEPVDHAVFMGMGEPMLNFDEVLAAARRLPDLGITHRRTTISTVGWLPGLKRFVDEVDEPIRLALSLHAADGRERSKLMPVNDRYPIKDVLAECRRHAAMVNRRVYIEYVMLAERERLAGAGAQARGAARPGRLQGQSDPVQPDRDVRRLVARAHRRVQGRARPRTRAGDGAADAWARHRGGVRPARDGAEGGRAAHGAPGQLSTATLRSRPACSLALPPVSAGRSRRARPGSPAGVSTRTRPRSRDCRSCT